ncbi:MAG: hypothetical protein CML55_10655 [Rhodobacteraceae bacterium]|nr:hypothetical protein [Paracoccaceae bacterium]|tara:strand:+ start:60 stop:269 length:210 start_codon:yes stop_codon:yes gene_type:complete
MKLVGDWKSAWRWFSVQAGGLVVVLPIVWAEMSDEAKAAIPEEWLPWIVSVVGACVIIGRIIDQRGGKT